MSDAQPGPQGAVPEPSRQGPPAPQPAPAYPQQAEAGNHAQPSYGEARLPRGPYPEPRYGAVDPAVAGYAYTGHSVRTNGPAVGAKNPGVSLLASFFIPGLGSMINGDVGKGIVILLCYIVSVLLAFVLIGIPGVFGFWIFGMVDAYNGAKIWNARHGIYA
jgi:TM2 domain-containing membrane protein YozV